MKSEEMRTLRFIEGGETYLITGANGFIGSSIVFTLLELNRNALKEPCKIILAVRNYDKAVKIYGEILNEQNVSLMICDNKEALVVSDKVDWIICTAGVTKKENFFKYPVDTLRDNISGVYHCLELAKTKNVRGMLFVSSVQVYGRIGNDDISEDDFGVLRSMNDEAVYPESKRMGEMMCRAYYKQYKVPAKCVRLFHVYGEGEEYNNGTFLSDFISDIISGRNIIIKGSGDEIRNLCYISDVVEGIFYVLHKGESGEAYNLGSEVNNYTIKEIAELLCSLAEGFGKRIEVIIEGNRKSAIINRQVPNMEKLKSLGWKEDYENLPYNFGRMLEKLLR